MKLDNIDAAIGLASPSSVPAHRKLIEDEEQTGVTLELCHLQAFQDELDQLIGACASPGVALCQLAGLLSDRLEAFGALSARLTILLDEQAAAIGCGADIQRHRETHHPGLAG